MKDLYFCDACEVYPYLEQLLLKHIPTPITILYTENGKPYVEGNPIFFSLSHSKDKGAIAISDRPAGVDFEVFGRGIKKSILKRFSPAEIKEINSETDFLKNWTAKEAFIKMCGERIWDLIKRLQYYGGELYLDGQKQDVDLMILATVSGVATLCTRKEV